MHSLQIQRYTLHQNHLSPNTQLQFSHPSGCVEVTPCVHSNAFIKGSIAPKCDRGTQLHLHSPYHIWFDSQGSVICRFRVSIHSCWPLYRLHPLIQDFLWTTLSRMATDPQKTRTSEIQRCTLCQVTMQLLMVHGVVQQTRWFQQKFDIMC